MGIWDHKATNWMPVTYCHPNYQINWVLIQSIKPMAYGKAATMTSWPLNLEIWFMIVKPATSSVTATLGSRQPAKQKNFPLDFDTHLGGARAQGWGGWPSSRAAGPLSTRSTALPSRSPRHRLRLQPPLLQQDQATDRDTSEAGASTDPAGPLRMMPQ